MKKLKILLVAALGLVTLTACGTSTEDAAPTEANTADEAASPNLGDPAEDDAGAQPQEQTAQDKTEDEIPVTLPTLSYPGDIESRVLTQEDVPEGLDIWSFSGEEFETMMQTWENPSTTATYTPAECRESRRFQPWQLFRDSIHYVVNDPVTGGNLTVYITPEPIDLEAAKTALDVCSEFVSEQSFEGSTTESLITLSPLDPIDVPFESQQVNIFAETRMPDGLITDGYSSHYYLINFEDFGVYAAINEDIDFGLTYLEAQLAKLR